MPHNYQYIYRKLLLSGFLLLSLGGVMSGALLYLIKSPQSQADQYVSLADSYLEQAKSNDAKALDLLKTSEDMTRTALSYTPYDKILWDKLSVVRQDYKQALARSQNTQNYALSTLD